VRFAYNQDQTSPYNEPSKAQILAHIEQLKPLLDQNADVIAVLQQGFIGAWGEGYYTDISIRQARPLRRTGWIDRRAQCDSQRVANDADGSGESAPTETEIRLWSGCTHECRANESGGSIQRRQRSTHWVSQRLLPCRSNGLWHVLGLRYCNGTSLQVITNLRNYLAQETRYTPMGGETCAINPPTDDCASAGGGADTDMAFSHYHF